MLNIKRQFQPRYPPQGGGRGGLVNENKNLQSTIRTRALQCEEGPRTRRRQHPVRQLLAILRPGIGEEKGSYIVCTEREGPVPRNFAMV